MSAVQGWCCNASSWPFSVMEYPEENLQKIYNDLDNLRFLSTTKEDVYRWMEMYRWNTI